MRFRSAYCGEDAPVFAAEVADGARVKLHGCEEFATRREYVWSLKREL